MRQGLKAQRAKAVLASLPVLLATGQALASAFVPTLLPPCPTTTSWFDLAAAPTYDWMQAEPTPWEFWGLENNPLFSKSGDRPNGRVA